MSTPTERLRRYVIWRRLAEQPERRPSGPFADGKHKLLDDLDEHLQGLPVSAMRAASNLQETVMDTTERALRIYRALQAAEAAHPDSPELAALHEELRLGYVENKDALGIREASASRSIGDSDDDEGMPPQAGTEKDKN